MATATLDPIAAQSEQLHLTPFAAQKVKEFEASNPEAAGKALRIYIEGGGCAGFQYGFAFDDPRDGDEIFDQHGVKIIVDPASTIYLQGSQVDFVEDFRGAGFSVSNPNATGSCGCGHSQSF